MRWVATSPRESFIAELDSRLSRSEYEGWWLLIGFIAAGDSAGKNAYHYRDPRSNALDEVFHYIPWDFNDSFGQNWRSIRRMPDGSAPDTFTRLNMIFERLLTEPETREPLLARFRDVLDGVWSADAVVAQLDEWNAQIHQVALRDEKRWGAAYVSFFTQYRNNDLLSHEAEVALRAAVDPGSSQLRLRHIPPDPARHDRRCAVHPRAGRPGSGHRGIGPACAFGRAPRSSAHASSPGAGNCWTWRSRSVSAGGRLVWSCASGAQRESWQLPGLDHGRALARILEGFDLARVVAVGHRVVHGGEAFRGCTRIDEPVLEQSEALRSLAPLHNPAADRADPSDPKSE